MKDGRFAPAEEVSDEIATEISNAVRGLKSRWRMRVEDWYHDLPVWLGIEMPPPSEPYRVAQAAVFLVGGEQQIEITCERRENLNGSIVLTPRIAEPFIRRLAAREAPLVKEALNELWEQATEFPRRRGSWEKIPVDSLPTSWEEVTRHVAEGRRAQGAVLDDAIASQPHQGTAYAPPRPSALIVDYRSAADDVEATFLEREAIISFFAGQNLPVRAGLVQDEKPPDEFTGTGGQAGVSVISLVLRFEDKLRGRLDWSLADIATEDVWNQIKNGLTRILQSSLPAVKNGYVQLLMRFGVEQWLLFRFDHGGQDAVEAIAAIRVPVRAARFFLQFIWRDNAWFLKAT